MTIEKVELGDTGLSVGRIGVGSSYGADETMIEEAADRGVNYFYWGALRTKRMARGIKQVTRGQREKFVVAAQVMPKFSGQVPKFVHKSLKLLNLDYIDILLLGWCNKEPSQSILEISLKMKECGYTRFLEITGHNRLLFPQLQKTGFFDIFHIRYNACHRGAEREVFDKMPQHGSPGIVTFTTTRWGSLIDPRYMPPGETPLRPRDCYRFSLSHPKVHVALCGPASRDELREDLAAFDEGPLDKNELQRIKSIGDYVYKTTNPLTQNLRCLRKIKP